MWRFLKCPGKTMKWTMHAPLRPLGATNTHNSDQGPRLSAPIKWSFEAQGAWVEEQAVERAIRLTDWQTEHAELDADGWERGDIGAGQSAEYYEEEYTCPLCMNERKTSMMVINCGTKSKGLHRACGRCLSRHWDWTMENSDERGVIKVYRNGEHWIHMRCPFCGEPTPNAWDSNGEVVNDLMAIRIV